MFRVLTCLTEQHDWRLVTLAGIICFLTSLVAVSLFRRATATRGRTRTAWIVTAGVAAGSGIWATHFIAMLAYEPGIPLHFNLGLTFFSLAASIAVISVGLTVGVHGRPAWRASATGGTIGLGVALMHYSGMQAVEVPGHADWSIGFVLVSILAAVAFSAAAIAVASAWHGARATLAAAILLTLGIVAHHFTAMGAVVFAPDPTVAVTGVTLPAAILAVTIAGVTMLVLGIAFALAVVDRLLAERNSLLDSALENITQGITVFDASGRLLLINDQYRDMYGLSADTAIPGIAMRDVLAQRLAAGTFSGDPDQYAARFIGGEWKAARESKLADGRIILVEIKPRPGGGWVATHKDITELRWRESSFRLMFESNPIPMWVNDRESLCFLDVNAAAIEHYGYSREQFLAMTVLDIRASEDWAELRAAVAERDNAAGRARRHIRADGAKIEVSVYTRSLAFSGRDAVLVAAIDVTARKMVEDEIRRTREFLHTVIDSVPAVIAVKDVLADHNYVLVNRKCEEFFGRPRGEIVGRNVYDLFDKDTADLLDARDRELERCGEQQSFEERPAHHSQNGIEFIATRRTVINGDDGKPRYLLSIIDNVTERRRAEEELRRTRAFLDTIIENVPATIIVREAKGDRRYVLINRACEKFLGTTRDKVIGRTVREVLPPSAAEIIEKRDQELLERGHAIYDLENLLKTPDKGDRYMTAQRLIVRDDKNEPMYLLTVIDDVTERRLAQDRLIETNELMQAVINASPVAISGSVPAGDIFIWNRAAESLFGYTAEEAVGRRVVDLIVPEDDLVSFEEGRSKAFSGECLRNVIEKRRRKDGSIIDAQLASAPVFAEDGSVRAVVVAIEDITNRKMLEDQLRQSQKMEAIGQLTGGLSHDFNNLLAIIIGNLDLLRDQVGWNPDAAEAVEEALGASLRGADLNRRLLAFARRQPLQPKNVDLNELVAGLTKLLERTLGEHIEISLSLAGGLWPLIVDPAQLESALTNLVVNARDAMPRGGRLTIGTRNISIDRDYAEIHSDVVPGNYVVLEVSDTGTGMPPDVVARVFEPFFTTKDKDKGTGLGLSMVFGFVKQSGGHVQIYSEVGIGTTIRLYLSRAASAGVEAKPLAAAALPRGHETVLAVEDNPGLRRILIRQLEDLGYQVLEAENAQSALEILKREPRIDLLFTDIVLPGGVNGSELARMAEAMRSDLKVLFTSGFPEAAFGPSGALPAGAMLLGKPYRKEELAQRLRESLAA
jgi:PAS domain S-box-containing protein